MGIIHIFLLCFIMQCTFASNCRTVDSSDHSVGYRITHGVFKNLNSIGFVGCQKECFKITKCQSIGYNRETLECSLGEYADNKTFTGVKTDIFIRPNGTDDALENIGLCRDRPCAWNERCVRLSSGTSTCIQYIRPIDLTVLIDGSKSLKSFEFYALFDGITYLINTLFDMRLAIATFNSKTKIPMYLDQYLSKSDMISGLNGNVVYPDKTGNYLGQALLDVHSDIYNQSRGDREEAIDVILVLLDPNDMIQANLREDADYIKSTGIHVITVGIGSSQAGLDTMQLVASEPIEKYVFSVNSIEHFYMLYENISDTINAIP
ncbi:Matrilin-3 [Mizuhopecten yessoensis]|uniref:Matrilin-3 n=1 Tax=Mizuhopecten yessoensis TaxID=6573 RepID=A0A210PHB3_MIZYE|nr:Matrilin-3 [Mizuhopecten yessoensis]